MLRSILNTGVDLCCRVTLTSCKAVTGFVASGKEQDVITLEPTVEAIKERPAHRQLGYEVNWTTLLSKVRNCGIQLFFCGDIEDLITELQLVIGEGLTELRPGCSHPGQKPPGSTVSS